MTVVLRPRPLGEERKTPEMQLIASGERVTRSEYEARYGADPEELKQVEEFARAHGLTVSDVSSEREDLEAYGDRRGLRQGISSGLGSLSMPRGDLPWTHRVSVHSNGLARRNHCRSRPRQPASGASPLSPRVQWAVQSEVQANAATSVSYTPLQVAQLYDFPAGVKGQGQTIGIIELGGGYTQSDLDSYFSTLGISPAPSVSAVSVDGAENQPTGDTSGPDTEVMLDIEVAGSVAPGAKIVVYFAPNTDSGFLDAINQAVGDKQNNPSVISISWGGAESTWTAQSLQSYNSALQAASAVGVSVCIAAGDDGSTDGVTDGLQHVDFPASSPYAIACGGTHLAGSGSTITSEVVWDDLPSDGATGGGVSATFPLPTWQAAAHVPPSVNPGNFVGRGVPDVAGDADPNTGYQMEVDGANLVVGGTSAVAPLWAGLIACFNSSLKTSTGLF